MAHHNNFGGIRRIVITLKAAMGDANAHMQGLLNGNESDLI